MSTKSTKERAIDLLRQLNAEDLRDVLDSFDVGLLKNTYSDVKELL